MLKGGGGEKTRKDNGQSFTRSDDGRKEQQTAGWKKVAGHGGDTWSRYGKFLVGGSTVFCVGREKETKKINKTKWKKKVLQLNQLLKKGKRSLEKRKNT